MCLFCSLETGRENTRAQKRRDELPVAYTKTLQKRATGSNQELQNKKRSSCPKTFPKPPRNINKTPKKLRKGEFFSRRFWGAKKGHFKAQKPPRKKLRTPITKIIAKNLPRKNLRQTELWKNAKIGGTDSEKTPQKKKRAAFPPKSYKKPENFREFWAYSFSYTFTHSIYLVQFSANSVTGATSRPQRPASREQRERERERERQRKKNVGEKKETVREPRGETTVAPANK